MPPKIFEKSKLAEAKKKGEDAAKEQRRSSTDSDDDDLSSTMEQGTVIGLEEQEKSDEEFSYTDSVGILEEAILTEKIKEIQEAQKQCEEISFQITEDLLPAKRDLLLEQVTNATDYWNQQKELVESSEENSDVSEQLLEKNDNILEQLYKIKEQLAEATDPFKGSIKKISLGNPAITSVKPLAKVLFVSDTDDSSDTSPSSSDKEYGAKTLMRKIQNYLGGIEEKAYTINPKRADGTEEVTEKVTEEEVKENPGTYYVANFRGDYLKYFQSSEERRHYVKEVVDCTASKKPPYYQSIAIKNLEKKYPKNEEKVQQEFDELKTPAKLQDQDFIKTYKSPTHFDSAVKNLSPDYGSPLISTSKDVKVSPVYADHPKEGASLHPKYSADKKPKHRLIGMTTVIIHEANEYLKRAKADIEKLREDNKIGGLSAIERNNQEILFDKEIETQNLAGYIPLIYPNLSKKYSSEERKLFGLENTSNPSISKGLPRSLGKTTKENSIYSILKRLQWRLAEKYVKDKNPEGELLWVDNTGKFNKFIINQQLEERAGVKKTAVKKDKVVRKLDSEFKDAVPPVKLKPVQDGTSKASQNLGLSQQVEEKLKRIGDPKEDYSDDDMKSLGEMLLPPDVHHVVPAIIYVANDLNQSISDGFINDPTKQHAIITIHSGNHFMGVYLHRATNSQISIIYFDPTVSKHGQQPLHNLPPNVKTILNQRFPTIPIINVGSEIQTYTTRKSGLEEFNYIDNHHCGPFVLSIMTEMSKGNIRLNSNGTRKLQIKFSDGSWKDFPTLSQEQSNNFGQLIRN